jgi:predicted RNA-binding protein YlqC (UPF0109 family)
LVKDLTPAKIQSRVITSGFSRVWCKGRKTSLIRKPPNPAMSEYPYVDFLEYLVKSIVDNPNDVRVDRKVDEMGVLLTLKVNAGDMGQVVGRNGSTAKAIRTLLRIVGIKHNARVNLKIEEPEGGRGPRRTASASASAMDDLKL